MPKTVVLFLLLVAAGTSFSQIIESKGFFLTDSTKIGSPVKYALCVKHPSGIQVLFPDSSFNYYPFELISKEYFPTRTKAGISTDSALYTLRTFDIRSRLSYALPVFSGHDEDSVTTICGADTIFIKEYLPEYPAYADFREQTNFNRIRQDFNYPHFLVYFLGISVLALIVYFNFGTVLRRRYRLLVIRSDHNSYLKSFQKLQNEFNRTKNSFSIEQALSVWKDYLSRLEHKPIHTYTTTEIIDLYNQEDLKEGLNIIDRAIYGGLITGEVEVAISTLKKFSIRQYHKIRREIQNA